MSKGKYYIKSI